MAYVEHFKKGNAMTARKRVVRTARREVLQAKSEKLSREQFERLYESVTSRISKTLAILAK